jgi:transcriptional/translational regulatory protein YebC/TACO1
VDVSDPEAVEKLNRFFERLDDNDDVQNYYHNASLPDEE